MNWLAHTLLSEDDVEFQLGNLLADIVRGASRESLGQQFLLGTARHKAIDAFTDAHPIVRRSRARLSAAHRRFSGVIMDVYYDHLLAAHWNEYADMSLDRFTADFYTAVNRASLPLPSEAQRVLERIASHDLLGSYRQLQGVERSLRRISTGLQARWHKSFELEAAVIELEAQRDAYERDFAEFFPQLQRHVQS